MARLRITRTTRLKWAVFKRIGLLDLGTLNKCFLFARLASNSRGGVVRLGWAWGFRYEALWA
jgi:hypothetical protein